MPYASNCFLYTGTAGRIIKAKQVNHPALGKALKMPIHISRMAANNRQIGNTSKKPVRVRSSTELSTVDFWSA